jgi:pyruvate/2-oxoglutarate dehydrogenase complex dihydrolipoamide dehydrogenase (E3) component
MIPEMKPWKIKLVFDKETQKLIGGQIISHAVGPEKQIDAVSALILGEKTVAEVSTFLCACNPDISSEPSMEPISIAADQVLRRLNEG